MSEASPQTQTLADTLSKQGADYSRLQRLSLVAGPAAFLICIIAGWSAPEQAGEALSFHGHGVLGLALWMALWWLTECVPIPATSLLPLGLLPALGVLNSQSVAAAYGHKMNILLMAGFMLARAIEKWNLHTRVALHVVSRFSAKPSGLLCGFMTATALLSMWISNTATTLMMLPIALACVGVKDDDSSWAGVKTAFVLGIAYSASVGGLGSPVGTPPNLIFMAQYQKLFPEAPTMSFLEWMTIGMPVVLLFIPVIALVLVKRFGLSQYGSLDDPEVLTKKLAALGPLSRGEFLAALLFAVTAFLWVFRAPMPLGFTTIPGWSQLFPHPKFIHDSSVAAFMVVVMFVCPVHWDDPEPSRRQVLDWETALSIPWGLLLLFGGGLALAAGFESSGLSDWVGQSLQAVRAVPLWMAVILLSLAITFLTEITSNTAMATLMMPILAVTASELKVDPKLLMIPAALSSSCAFMFPVATAPNAIAFGTGDVSLNDMARTGLILNLLGVMIISGVCLLRL